ncbi:hypothetical protein [Piscinibacter sp.]|jgi:hypothetical protein|uniref:hypothetical protein n=1 Tax=Piscinibacter sp. TaxID=1903157 RepID=UPI002F42DBF3
MRSLLLLTLLGPLALIACGGSSPDGAAEADARELPASAPTRNDSIVHVPFFIVDAGGQPPTASDTLLFEVRKHNPIVAPDGHQVTLAEFNAVQGSASVKCVTQGTHVTLHLTNLIPNGIYTIWNLVFKAPGFDPSFSNLIGLGALGSPDGAQNSFRASASGEGSVSAITGAGNLSMVGSIGACALTDEFEWHVVGAYHLDGQTHGATLGPDGTAVEQFGFIFKRTP